MPTRDFRVTGKSFCGWGIMMFFRDKIIGIDLSGCFYCLKCIHPPRSEL